MSVQNPDRVITKQDLKDFYTTILPYLGGGGHQYDIRMNSSNDSLVLTEDNTTKSTVPVSTIKSVTDLDEWNALSASEQAKYKYVSTQDGGYGTSYDIPYEDTTVGGELDILDNNKLNATNVAPIESTDTASKAYAQGDQLIYQGLLYNAKTAITQGATFTVGTNIQLSDSVTTQLASLNSALNNVPKKIESKSTTTSISVPANQISDVDLNVALAGYTAIGIVGVSVNGNPDVATIYTDLISASTARVRIRNLTSSIQSVTSVVVKVLYK